MGGGGGWDGGGARAQLRWREEVNQWAYSVLLHERFLTQEQLHEQLISRVFQLT